MSGTVLVAAHVGTAEADTADGLRARVVGLEDAGAHLLTFAGGSGGLGLSPVEAAAFAAAWTSRVALVPVVNPVHTEPFHLSNQLSSLDRISRGRAGWWVEVSDDAQRARAYGRQPVGGALRQEVTEVVQVVRLLWDSWEDGALVADEASGRFLDADRVHHVDFVGERFAIKGPALLPRPPQGHVPVLASSSWLEGDLPDVTVLPGSPAPPADDGDGPTLVDVVLDDEAIERDVDAGVSLAVGQVRRLVDSVTVVRLVPTGPRGAGAVTERLLPALRTSGLVAPAAGGRTLRDLLGLPCPAGRLVAVPDGVPVGATSGEEGSR